MPHPVRRRHPHPHLDAVYLRHRPEVGAVILGGGDDVRVTAPPVGGVGQRNGIEAEMGIRRRPGDGERRPAPQHLPTVRRRQRDGGRGVIYAEGCVGGVGTLCFAIGCCNPDQTLAAIREGRRVETVPEMGSRSARFGVGHLIEAIRPGTAVIQAQVDVVGDDIPVDVQAVPGDRPGAAEVLSAVGQGHGHNGGTVVEDARHLNLVYTQQVGVGVGQGVLEADNDLSVFRFRDGEEPDQPGVLRRGPDHAHIVNPPAIGLIGGLAADGVAFKDPAPLHEATGGG